VGKQESRKSKSRLKLKIMKKILKYILFIPFIPLIPVFLIIFFAIIALPIILAAIISGLFLAVKTKVQQHL